MKKYRLMALLLVLALLFSFPAAAVEESTSEESQETTAAPTETVAEPPSSSADFLTPPAPLQVYNYPTDFTIDAAAYALIELNSNTVIYGHELDMRRYPASLTKLMTCMLAIEYGNGEDILTVSATALQNLSEFGSTAGLVEGEQMKLDDLLYCIMLWSANEGCNVIAEHISGDIESFVDLMNETAQALGMKDTHFANTHGLHNENHYTTVRDLMILARWAWQNKTFRRYATSTVYEVPATNKSEARTLHTTNYLTSTDIDSRYFYSRASGIKTGFTTPAGGCLIATATDGEAEYMSIVMGCDLLSTAEDMRFIETRKLFRHAFDTYSFVQVLSNTKTLSQPEVKNAEGRENTVPVHAAKDASVLLPNDYRTEDILVKLRYDNELTAPLAEGQTVGKVTVEYQGVELATSDLLTLKAVESVPQTQEGEEQQTDGEETESKSLWSYWFVVIPLSVLGLVLVLGLIGYFIRLHQAKRRAEMRRRRQERRRRYDV